MSAAEVTESLGLHGIRNRSWYIQACCSTSGDGLMEGLDWIGANLSKDAGEETPPARRTQSAGY